MNKQVIVVIAAAIVVFAVAIGASFALIGGSGDDNTHTMPGGNMMSGQMHTMSDGSTMQGMTMTMP